MQHRYREIACLVVLTAMLVLTGRYSEAAQGLVLESKIPLGAVWGRIDHLAIDLARERLFVAELGNNSLGIVDLAKHKVVHRITGLNEPQGVGYVPESDTIFVADGGDGTVHRFRGSDFAAIGSADLGEDADNVRVSSNDNQVAVGYGEGALAFIDGGSGAKKGDIPLPGHPESFQLERLGTRAFVNVPEARQIVVLDLRQGRQVTAWAVPYALENFPMALDEREKRLAVVFRKPPVLAILDVENGKIIAELPTCGDADDIFFDEKRSRLYISCGEGAIAVIHKESDSFRELARIPTTAGARTSLFIPTIDRLVLAARANEREGAALWIFRPLP